MIIRAERTQTRQYEVELENYPVGSTPEQILAIDGEAAADDPDFFFDDCEIDIKIGEVK